MCSWREKCRVQKASQEAELWVGMNVGWNFAGTATRLCTGFKVASNGIGIDLMHEHDGKDREPIWRNDA